LVLLLIRHNYSKQAVIKTIRDRHLETSVHERRQVRCGLMSQVTVSLYSSVEKVLLADDATHYVGLAR
jgi:hypothetical protein